MNQEESVALWWQGKDAWNAWAEATLVEKKTLKDAGAWQVNEKGEGQNDETRKWMKDTTVDLSGMRFMTRALADLDLTQAGIYKDAFSHSSANINPQIVVEGDVIDFSGFVFPCQAWFGGAQFYGQAAFGAAQFYGQAGFRATQFHKVARFDRAHFHATVEFQGAEFVDNADFSNGTFSGEVTFWGARFRRFAWFNEAQFKQLARFSTAVFDGWAWFEMAQFCGEARFGGAAFHNWAGFKGVKFLGLARFVGAKFSNGASFRGAQFGYTKNLKDAEFNGVKVERTFDMTGAAFSKVPAFNQADFAQAPDLDDVTYPFPPFFRFWIRGWDDEAKTVRRAETLKADAAKYRHLRRLAILGHDHENEAKAFKGETRAKRGTEHYPWLAAFWLGVGYDALSDFGRSMMRPFYAWLALTAAFAAFYYWSSDAPSLWACAPAAKGLGAGIAAWGEAAYLGIKNGLIVIGLGSESKINQAHACLYGGTIQEPVFPSGLSVWQIAQNVLSAPLIFLFLLGVRNQFKIK